MALAGKNALVKTTGTAVAFVTESTTTSDNLTYKILNTTKEIWCPFCTITVLDGGVPTVEDYILNRLAGTVEFQAAIVRVITLTGQFLPVTTVAHGFEFDYSISADNADSTEFGNQWIRRTQTLKDFSSSISRFENMDYMFHDKLVAEESLVLEFFEDSAGPADIRARVLIATEEDSAAVDGLVEASLDFEGSGDAEGRVVTIL